MNSTDKKRLKELMFNAVLNLRLGDDKPNLKIGRKFDGDPDDGSRCQKIWEQVKDYPDQVDAARHDGLTSDI